MPHLEDEYARLFRVEVLASDRITFNVLGHTRSIYIPFIINQGGKHLHATV